MRPESDEPLAASGDRHFDLHGLAADSDAANRPIAWIAIGFAGVVLALWAFFGVGWVQSGFENTPSFIVISVVFVLVSVFGVVAGMLARKPRNPIAIVVGNVGFRVEYPDGVVRGQAWTDRNLMVWLMDQRKRKGPRFLKFTDFGLKFRGSRWVVGGVGFSPITQEAYDQVLATARQLELPISAHPLNLGRATATDVTVHRIRRPHPG